GTSGSSTRTMSRNIMVLKASEVSRIMAPSPRKVDGSKMVPTPEHASHQRDHDSGQNGFDGSRQIQSKYQFSLGNRRDQVAFVDATRLVVDIKHAPANHDRNKHGQCDRSREQVLHVLDVGIEFDDLKRGLAQNSWLNFGLVQSRGQLGQALLERRTHEVVGVIDHQGDARVVLFVDSPRVLWRNDDCALDFAVTDILHGLLVVIVVDGHEGADIGAHRIESFANLQRLSTAVLIDQSHLGIANLAAKGIAQHNELHQWKDHRHQHQGGGAEELAHLALDDGQHAIHGCNPGRGGITKPCALTSSSRNWRPV